MTRDYEVLSRLLDGEPVDEVQLCEALAQPEGVGLLREWAELRRLLRDDLGQPDDEFCDRMRQRLRTPGWRRLFQERLVPVGVAASLLAAALLGYGVRWSQEPAVPNAPVPPPLVAQQRPPTPAPPTTAAVPSQPATGAPSAEKPPLAVPRPQVRVPFAQWRDSTRPN